MKKEYPTDYCLVCHSKLEYCLTEPDIAHPYASWEKEYICFHNSILVRYQNKTGEFITFEKYHYTHYADKNHTKIIIIIPPYNIIHNLTHEQTAIWSADAPKKLLTTPLWKDINYSDSPAVIDYVRKLLVFS